MNDKRNAIVHRGSFAVEKDARAYVELTREIVLALVAPWEPAFSLNSKLPDKRSSKCKKR